MAYNTFPTSVMAPSYGLDEEDVMPQISTTFDDGTVKAGDKYTRSRQAWNLQWDNLPEVQLQTLKTFWRANRSLRFYWTHPITAVTYLCQFGATNLKSMASEPGHRRTQLMILET